MYQANLYSPLAKRSRGKCLIVDFIFSVECRNGFEASEFLKKATIPELGRSSRKLGESSYVIGDIRTVF